MKEIFISSIIIFLAIFSTDNVSFWMPNSLFMSLIFLLLILFAIYASFVFKERARDERELVHRGFAGRFAFLAGTSVAVIGIVFQSFSHNIDVWLVFTLVSMIVTKNVALMWSKRYL